MIYNSTYSKNQAKNHTKPPLPMRTDALIELLRKNVSLRTQLVNAGLKAWRSGDRNRRRFKWHGRNFVIFQTIFRFVVTDAKGRWLVGRWD